MVGRLETLKQRVDTGLRFGRTGFGALSKFKLGLLGFSAPLRLGESPSRVAGWLSNPFVVRPSRLRGLRVALDPSDWSQTVIYDEIFVSKGYDLSRIGFQPDRVVDCGAHIGLFSLLATASFPGASLTLFEPNPENERWIQSNFALNDLDCDCRRSAVGSEARTTCLNITNSHSAQLNDDVGVPTEVINLTDFVVSLESCRLLLKIDIEGEERAVWPQLIPKLPMESAVFFETHHGEQGWSDAADHFLSHGFELERTTQRGQFCDGVAVRKR